MFIDGEVEAYQKLYSIKDSAASSGPRDGFVKVFKPGSCFGEECFELEDYKVPFNMVCSQRAMTLNLKRKDFAEVLLF